MLHAGISLVAVLVLPSLAFSDEKPHPPAAIPPELLLPKAVKKDRAIQNIPVEVTYHIRYSEEVFTPDGKRMVVIKHKTLSEVHFKRVMSKTPLVAGSREFQDLYDEVYREESKKVVPKNPLLLFIKKMLVIDFAWALDPAQGPLDDSYEVIKVKVRIIVPEAKVFPPPKTADK